MGRAPCCSKVGLNRGPWSIEEDRLLTHYIQTHGEGHWRALPSEAGLLRCGKSCRLRWVNYLRPGVKRGNFTSDENDSIIRLHSLHGNRWSLIAAEFPGRTDNEIKNHWNTHLRKRALAVQNVINSAETTSTNDPNDHRNKIDASDLEQNVTLIDTEVLTKKNDADLTHLTGDSAGKITILPETYSNEEDQKGKSTSSADQNCQESTKVNHPGTPSISGCGSSSSTNSDKGEVDYDQGGDKTDTFFFELDDLLDVDLEMDGRDSMSRYDGNEQFEGIYMEYLQLLN